MPFISKDWRSPGEEWVKTVEGWEKKKILECANNKTLSLLLRYVIVSIALSLSFSLSLRSSTPVWVSLYLARTSPSLYLVLCSFRDSARRTAVTPAFTSIRLTAPFVYILARASCPPIPFVSRKRRMQDTASHLLDPVYNDCSKPLAFCFKLNNFLLKAFSALLQS